MRNRDLARQKQALDGLIAKTRNATGGDVEMQSHWAKYLCVLFAGFLENALAELYGDYCRRSANPAVANFAVRSLTRIRNPKTNVFVEVCGAFNKAWAESLEAFIEDDGRREAINSIMVNRHLIAHGKDSGITVARVNEYFAKALTVLDFIEQQCK